MINRTKTLVFFAVLTALLLFVGQALGGRTGLVIAIVIAGITNLCSYWFSDRILLRMYRSHEVTANSAPELYRIVQKLAYQAELPVPRIYVIPEAAPNAFATGRNPANAAVAVTEGLLRLLSTRELEGVLAHELAHVRNRDTLIMTVAASIAGALSMIANMAAWGAMLGQGRSSDDEGGGSHPIAGLFGVLVAPFAASVVQMAISRSREFAADESAARLTRDPIGLANALLKIEAWSRRTPMAAHPATAHLFIISPLIGGGLSQLFSTHPKTAARVERLRMMTAADVAA